MVKGGVMIASRNPAKRRIRSPRELRQAAQKRFGISIAHPARSRAVDCLCALAGPEISVPRPSVYDSNDVLFFGGAEGLRGTIDGERAEAILQDLAMCWPNQAVCRGSRFQELSQHFAERGCAVSRARPFVPDGVGRRAQA